MTDTTCFRGLSIDPITMCRSALHRDRTGADATNSKFFELLPSPLYCGSLSLSSSYAHLLNGVVFNCNRNSDIGVPLFDVYTVLEFLTLTYDWGLG